MRVHEAVGRQTDECVGGDAGERTDDDTSDDVQKRAHPGVDASDADGRDQDYRQDPIRGSTGTAATPWSMRWRSPRDPGRSPGPAPSRSTTPDSSASGRSRAARVLTACAAAQAGTRRAARPSEVASAECGRRSGGDGDRCGDGAELHRRPQQRPEHVRRGVDGAEQPFLSGGDVRSHDQRPARSHDHRGEGRSRTRGVGTAGDGPLPVGPADPASSPAHPSRSASLGSSAIVASVPVSWPPRVARTGDLTDAEGTGTSLGSSCGPSQVHAR